MKKVRKRLIVTHKVSCVHFETRHGKFAACLLLP